MLPTDFEPETFTSAVSVKYDFERKRHKRQRRCGKSTRKMTVWCVLPTLQQSRPGKNTKEVRGRPKGSSCEEAPAEDPHVIHDTHTHRTPTRQVTAVEIQTTPSLLANLSPFPAASPGVQQCLKRLLNLPLSKDEERLHTTLTRRKLKFASDKAIVGSLLCSKSSESLGRSRLLPSMFSRKGHRRLLPVADLLLERQSIPMCDNRVQSSSLSPSPHYNEFAKQLASRAKFLSRHIRYWL